MAELFLDASYAIALSSISDKHHETGLGFSSAKLKVEVDDSQVNIDDGKVDVDDGQIKVDDGEVKVDEGEVKVDEGEVKVDEGEVKVDDGEVKVDDGEVKVDDGQIKVDDGEVKVDEDQGRDQSRPSTIVVDGVRIDDRGAAELLKDQRECHLNQVNEDAVLFEAE